jgi:hypothetical protein
MNIPFDPKLTNLPRGGLMKNQTTAQQRRTVLGVTVRMQMQIQMKLIVKVIKAN